MRMLQQKSCGSKGQTALTNFTAKMASQL